MTDTAVHPFLVSLVDELPPLVHWEERRLETLPKLEEQRAYGFVCVEDELIERLAEGLARIVPPAQIIARTKMPWTCSSKPVQCLLADFDPQAAAQQYPALADRLLKAGGYFAVQQVTTSISAAGAYLEEQATKPAAADHVYRVFSWPNRERSKAITTLLTYPALADRLDPHNFSHYAVIVQAGLDLYLCGTMPRADALVWYDDPGSHLKSAAQMQRAAANPQAFPDGKPELIDEEARAPSEGRRVGSRKGYNVSALAYSAQTPLCRAANKLREVFEGSPHHLTLPPGARAVDIGAAPGGWTEYLARHCELVVAVDPAMLSQAVTALPNVVHFRARVQDAMPQMLERGPYDLVVCDMNTEMDNCLAIVREVIPVMRPGALLVVTAKLRSKSVQYSTRTFESCHQQLGEEFADLEWRWLFANKLRERTLIGRRRATATPAE